ncbi:glomulin-like isoform X1 [Zerene cesonia]|uniref:glomulin-like isoform X1 n=1 Tax=Zerene cesonia TaxID=33412 RepID=UPI0018E4F4FD|nr:glomulin-like isoform X1 [Zerene cesonia]
MDQKTDVVDLVSTLLDSGKYKEALSVPNKKQYAESFKDNCWDLISIVVSKVENDTITLKPSLYGACEELLSVIIEKATPEEALLEIIEQIEVAKNDAQFSIILNPLQKLLKKLSVKRGRSLEWCLNSISTYIEAIPIPDHHLEGKERLLMDSDSNARRIVHVYSLLPSFYQPFVEELSKNDCNNKTVYIIAAFLISLFGKPLIYMDLDPESGINSQLRQCCETILKDVCTLVKNILKFMPYLENSYKESQIANSKKKTSDNDDDVHPYEHREKINVTTLSGLFYLTFSGDFVVPDYAIPQVFSHEYMVHNILLSVNHFLQFAEYGPQIKGLTLCNNILNLYENKTSHTFLTLSIHYDLCKSLINLSIYSSYETVRKNSVKLIGIHINKFDYKGRIMLIKYIIDIANHSGMIGYAITQYKNSLDEAFKESYLPECFSGAQFLNMVKKICYLPYGVESDLVELADQIITALNFLRYLALKDAENKTGIRECFPIIETDYLDNLRTGLNMSKAHYEMKLKELEESKDICSKEDKVSINIGGKMLDKIPTKNKKEIIHSALNAFHLIEGLVGRLTECVHINKAHVYNE